MNKCCAECNNYELANNICKEYKEEIRFPLYKTLYCDKFETFEKCLNDLINKEDENN